MSGHCRNAFTAIHSIGNKKVEYFINSLKLTGHSPKDQRRKHQNRKHKHNDDVFNLIKAHIKSFNGRGAHYFTKDSSKKYLPEYLSVSKMHTLFKEKYPDVKVSYESYRTIFNTYLIFHSDTRGLIPEAFATNIILSLNA